MQTFLVGGAVRDTLLNRPVKDRDYVVVGGCPEALLARGFKQVGADFPVFLHPQSSDEYALARTERKTGTGYQGFTVHASPEVTLEEDLSRRDLTINAMAMDDKGALVDPFNGQADLAAGVLRHVGPAFAEDPVRLLRIARFAARYPNFTVAAETMALMQNMVLAGEADALVAERVWQELSRGLMEAHPSRMLAVLQESGVLARILPEVARLFGVPQPVASHPEIDTGIHTLLCVDWAAQHGGSLPVRFAALLHDVGKGVTPKATWPAHHGHEALGVPLVESVCARWKVPSICRELALLVTEYHTLAHNATKLTIPRLVKLLKQVDAFRRPARFADFVQACAADAGGRTGREAEPYPQAAWLQQALVVAAAVDAGAVAQQVVQKSFIPERVHAARVQAVKQAFARKDGS